MKKIAIISLAVAGVISLGAILFTSISWGQTANALGEYKNQLEYVYERNLYELIDNINNVESNLSKLEVATSNSVQSKYLASIVAETNSAQNNLSALPIEHNAINSTTQLINQLSGFCLVKQQTLSTGGTLSLDDFDQIDSLHTSAESVKYELNRLSNMIASGYSIVDNIKNPNEATSDFNNQFSSLKNDVTEYPQLIYDGPFSDSVMNREIRGLPEGEINAEDGVNLIHKWFGGASIKDQSETEGDFATFNYSIELNNEDYFVQITKQGGLLLSVDSHTEAVDPAKSLDECEVIAVRFANKVGLEDVVSAWSTINNGYAYINLTYSQDGVIIYPDMIKVKINLASGEVVGWEAREWAYNHVVRSNLSATIDEIQARKQVPDSIDVRSSRLCVIPNDYVGETLAWEFMGVFSGSTYYVYVDALSGQQVNILRVIETDDGDLLM